MTLHIFCSLQKKCNEILYFIKAERVLIIWTCMYWSTESLPYLLCTKSQNRLYFPSFPRYFFTYFSYISCVPFSLQQALYLLRYTLTILMNLEFQIIRIILYWILIPLLLNFIYLFYVWHFGSRAYPPDITRMAITSAWNVRLDVRPAWMPPLVSSHSTGSREALSWASPCSSYSSVYQSLYGSPSNMPMSR